MMHLEVAVRVRPLTAEEKKSQRCVTKKRLELIRCQDNMVFLLPPDPSPTEHDRPERTYTFDRVFPPSTKNAMVYKTACQKLVGHIIDGYNATCFAYGMTGAGKTHTIFGNVLQERVKYPEAGIYTMTIEDMFTRMQAIHDRQFVVKISFLEIYNEQIKDLLSKKRKQELHIRQEAKRGIVVSGLSEVRVSTIEDVHQLIRMGLRNRTMAATSANEISSRSHAVFQMTLFQKNRARQVVDSITVSKLSLIDLAGSERASASKNEAVIRKDMYHIEIANLLDF